MKDQNLRGRDDTEGARSQGTSETGPRPRPADPFHGAATELLPKAFMGEPIDRFDGLAHALVQALDQWAQEVAKVTDDDKSPSRLGLINLLEDDANELLRLHNKTRKKIDGPLLTYWLKGRNQLLAGSKRNRLPSEEDSAAIARVLKQKAPRCAARLPKISAEIAVLSSRLGDADPQWRDKVLSRLTASS
ncbi:hypothetical protein [Streptomyces sp. NPDC059909]|uniref:hypothetical protein n=1 Tax=Streptomyces sp. NPDC059909 TaxID=3346998 RepID=UPI00364745FB